MVYDSNPRDRCPDGYRGGYEGGEYKDGKEDNASFCKERLEREKGTEYGYPDFQGKFDGNPFSNKIIIMDEVHNLINPSQEMTAPQRQAIENLRLMLKTATNSVLVGLTATPLGQGDSPDDEQKWDKELLDVIRGDINKDCESYEGFISYFMEEPPSSPDEKLVFPKLQVPETLPSEAKPGVLNASGLEPPSALRSFELSNFSEDSSGGNLWAYGEKAKLFKESSDDAGSGATEALSRYCSLGMGASKLKQYNISSILSGAAATQPSMPSRAVSPATQPSVPDGRGSPSSATAEDAEPDHAGAVDEGGDGDAQGMATPTPKRQTPKQKARLLGADKEQLPSRQDSNVVLLERAHGFCTKLAVVVDDVLKANADDQKKTKTLVLVHSKHGYQLLLELFEKSGVRVLGYDGKNDESKQNLEKFISDENR